MEQNKQISIIIPAYNLGQHIIRTLNSLIKQDTKRMEVIIIDDGSTDNTVTIVEKFLIKHSEIECRIIKKKNGGVSSARNRGINEAKGEYIFFLDGDDYVSDDFIETIEKNISEKSLDVLCWGYDTVFSDKKVISSYFNDYNRNQLGMDGIETLYGILIEKKLSIWTCSAIYKRRFLLQHDVYYTEGCANGEDLEFTFKALLNAKKVLFIDKVLSFYVQREGSISNSYDIKRFDSIGAMQRTYELMKQASDPRLEEIVIHFRNKEILSHYFVSLHSCINYSEDKGIGEIISEIDRKYPELNKKMRLIMKQAKNIEFKETIRINLFLLSPTYYLWLIKIKNKIRGRQV